MVDLDAYGLDPYLQHRAMTPFHPPAGGAACARLQPGFATIERQRMAFDDDPNAPVGADDISAARAVCFRCPVLDACRDYARRSCVDDGVLAGMTADERRTRRRKRDQVTLRDHRVRAFADLGVSTADLADLFEVDVTAIRSHLRGWTACQAS